MICNRGGELRRPMEIYHYNESSLTSDIIVKIRGSLKQNEENYRKLFYEELSNQLGFSMNHQDFKIQEQGDKLYAQVLGNCSWVSSTTSVYAFLMLSGGELEKQRETYKNWLGFQQIYSIERIVNLIGTTGYEPDHELIQKAISMALFPCYDLPLTKKLDDLINSYAITLPPEDQERFQNNLILWKSTVSAYNISQRQIVL